MTEEELKAIELLKEDIDYRESDLAEYISDRKYSNAERTIINLVNKQQEEIKRLNSIINTDNIINKERAELIEQQQKEIEKLKKPKYIIDCETGTITRIDNNFIHKDKIKEKIKELNNKNINADGISAIFNITKIQTLEELLEE